MVRAGTDDADGAAHSARGFEQRFSGDMAAARSLWMDHACLIVHRAVWRAIRLERILRALMPAFREEEIAGADKRAVVRGAAGGSLLILAANLWCFITEEEITTIKFDGKGN